MKLRIFLAGLFIIVTVVSAPIAASALDVGAHVPDVALPQRGGGTRSLSEFKGKVVYFDFWASWCGPCKHSLPWMKSLTEKFKGQNFQVIAVNIDNDPESAEALLEELNPNFLVMFDTEKVAIAGFEPPKMPSSFLIDQRGKVTQVFAGFHEGDEDKIELQIEALLKSAN